METQQENKSASEGQMTSLDDDLDELALERLELLDNLLKNKQMLAEYMKTGFYNLGKARYSLGGHAVSALRIPETSIVATTRTLSNEENSNSQVMYTARKIIKNCARKVEENEDSGRDSQIEELDLDLNALEGNVSKQPINWFSALPPVALRQAQSQFESALQLAAQCASLQDQLSALNERCSNLEVQ